MKIRVTKPWREYLEIINLRELLVLPGRSRCRMRGNTEKKIICPPRSLKIKKFSWWTFHDDFFSTERSRQGSLDISDILPFRYPVGYSNYLLVRDSFQ